MFEFAKQEPVASKCYVTHGRMGHLDPLQPPTRRKPFAAILAMPFIHKVELLLPIELYDLIKVELLDKFSGLAYSRVILSLISIVEGDFFNEYVKKGNVLMLSEGHQGMNNIYTLREGLLTLRLDKESYERAGLVGKPEGVKGKRGNRARWVVEIDLRQPSMLHGKKALDRIIYAFKNVLTTPVTWLFIDLAEKSLSPAPIEKYFPVSSACCLSITEDLKLAVPQFKLGDKTSSGDMTELRDSAADIYEWLSLVSLQSPRVFLSDEIDPFLSRYRPPTPEAPQRNPQNLVSVRWQGFMSASIAHRIFVLVMQRASPELWLSFSANGFNNSLPEDCKECSILKLPGPSHEYVLWEVDQK